MKITLRMRLLHYAVRAAVALMSLAVIAVGAARTPWFQKALRQRVQSAIQQATGARVEIERMKFSPLLLRLSFGHLTLHGTEPASQPPLFSAQNLIIEISPWGLLRRRWRARSVIWESATIHLLTNADGSTNLPTPPASARSGQPAREIMNWSVGAMALGRTSLFWNNRQIPFALNASEVALLVRQTSRRSYEGGISSNRTSLHGPFGSLPPIRFAARFEIAQGQLRVPQMSWHIGDMAGSAAVSVTRTPALEARFSLAAVGGIRRLAESLHSRFVKNGDTVLQAKGSYSSSGLKLQGHIRVRRLEIDSPAFSLGPAEIASAFVADGAGIEFSPAELRALGGSAVGRMNVFFASPPRFTIGARIDGADLASLLRAFPSTRFLGDTLKPAARISGKAEVAWQGDFNKLRSQLALTASPPAPALTAALPLTARAQGEITHDRGLEIQLSHFELHSPGSTMTAQGVLASQNSNLNLAAESTNFQEWSPLADLLIELERPIPLLLKSPGRFSGVLTGPMAAPRIQGKVKAGAFSFAGGDWDGFEGDVAASSSAMELRNARLMREHSVIHLGVKAGLDHWEFLPQSIFQVSLKLEQTPVKGLEAGFGIRPVLTGLASGQLDLQGVIGRLDGAGHLTFNPLSVAGEGFDSGSADVKISRSTWILDHIRLTKGQGEATGQAKISPAGHSFTAALSGKNFSLADLRPVPSAAMAAATGPALHGTASFELNARGWVGHVTLGSQLDVQRITYAGTPLGDLKGQLNWQGDHGRLVADLDGPGGRVYLASDTRTGGEWSSHFTGRFDEFRLDPWLQYLAAAKFGAQVRASGSFELAGPLKDPGKLAGSAAVESLEIGFPSAKWKNSVPVAVRYEQGVLAFSPFHMRGPATDFLVQGSLRLAAPAALNLDATGEADAASLRLLDPAIRATGRSAVKVHVGSTLDNPSLNGTMTVSNLNLEYGDLPFRLSGLSGAIQLQGDRAILDNLQGSSGGGRVRLSGFVTLGEIPRYRIEAAVEQVQVHYPSDFVSVLDGRLQLSGAGDRGELGGEIGVRDLLVSPNFNPFNYLASASETASAVLTGVSSPEAERIGLNIAVNSAAPLGVSTHQVQLSADLRLRIRGTLASPVALGTIELERGNAVFRGNRYRLTRGEINMTNPFRTQPELQLDAQTRIDRYDLTLEISGPLDRLKIGYRSDPPLATEDIVRLLALGYTPQQEAVTQAGTRPFSSVGASALLSEALSSQVSTRIQRLFGVSRIRIDPNAETLGAGTGPRVTVEQQLSPDFTLTYSTVTSNSQYRVIRFEWALSDQASLVGVRDINGVFGLELKLRHRFK